MTAGRLLRRGAALVVLLLATYLLFWPTPVRPAGWQPPPPPPLRGVYASNHRLAGTEWIARGQVQGPEATAFDREGRLYTGTVDGRIVRLQPDGTAAETFSATGGRPLGLAFDRAGRLWVADAQRGLISVAPDGKLEYVAAGEGGVPFHLTNDVDVADDGTVYFTDASSRFGLSEYVLDLLEHGPNGRLLAYHPASRQLERLAGGLHFPNGVALSPDQSFVALAETGTYRVLKVFRAGPRAGQIEPLLENLPGFPDNITAVRGRAGSRIAFWLALASPRDRIAETLAPRPFLTRMTARLPARLQPKPKRHGFVVGLSADGQVLENLQDDAPGSYSPLTSVREHEGFLYFGSMARDALGRLRAPP